ncbi:hypothetical protein NDU88_003465 [Pleurodeles waltl]|uniref:Uncharacterized protein n=1 Tax=Pleurodeles waltl TaxID=8319 RepID=A0AAV7TNP3_PLEWA|nr:hypothetical protein NDU88_003465 [Pleurodeles waltl]
MIQTDEGHCDGLARKTPRTKPTCAGAARGVLEHHGESTNEGRSSPVMSGFQAGTRKEEVEKRLATASGSVEGVEEENCEEERREPGESDEESGEWFLPSWGEKEDEAANGGLHPAVAQEALGSGCDSPLVLEGA